MNSRNDSRDSFVAELRSAYLQDQVAPAPLSDIVAGARYRRRRNRQRLGLLAGLATACAAAAVAFPQFDAPDNGRSTGPILMASPALERWGSTTAGDWVQNATVVVLGHVSAEEAGERVPAGDGTGDVVIKREVHLFVDRILWRAPEARIEPGAQVKIGVPGWIARNGEETPLALVGMPRVQSGETYLIALRRDSCNGEWAYLGSNAVWAANGGVVGTGESEGATVTPDSMQADPDSLESQMLGHSASEVTERLNAAARRVVRRDMPTC